ncbi:MAG: hypothetical protein AAGI24_10900 [Pseudomonadota bacterium]
MNADDSVNDKSAPLPVVEEQPAPKDYFSLGEISASSQGFSGRTDHGKQAYVMRELQRKARALGANAIWLKNIRTLKRAEPVYGRFNNIAGYKKIENYLGQAEAIRLLDPSSAQSSP